MRYLVDFVAIVFFCLLAYLIISLLIRDARNKKIKENILNDSVESAAIVKNVQSRSGGNSGFINVTLYVEFATQEGKIVTGKKDAVIDAMSTYKYQPGETVSIRYSRKEPEQFLIDIPNPLLKRK
ncbi:hypothetical protein ACWWI0_004015 [Cronobacter sakazakii]